MKLGFYFYELFGNLGSIVLLVYPNGESEKIYIGDNDLINKFILSDEWYPAVIFNSGNWEYIGL